MKKNFKKPTKVHHNKPKDPPHKFHKPTFHKPIFDKKLFHRKKPKFHHKKKLRY